MTATKVDVRLTKRLRENQKKLTVGKVYKLDEAIDVLKSLKMAKFDESFDVAINLGVDAKKSDQGVRGSTVLPYGSGRTVRVAVFAQGPAAAAAKEAGADIVGFEDLAEKIKGGALDFDVLIATPDAMRILGALGKVLGPKGLMPNPKDGTVTSDTARAVKNAKSGQVQYRTDKNGIIHCAAGKMSFDVASLLGNVRALLESVVKLRPESAKGVYLKSLVVSSTMGPGLKVEIASLGLLK